MARQTLTDRKVQSIKAAAKGKRSQTMDGLVPGFGVRVTDTGAKTYIFQARFPGSANQARREIAKVDAITLEPARDKARGWAALIKQGIDPVQVEQKAKEEQAQLRANTFGGIISDYFERKLAKQRSGAAIRKRIEKNQLPIFKDTPITEITDLDILVKVVNPRVVRTPSQARQLFNDPRATTLSASSGSGRCSGFASSHGARIQTSRSSSVVRITGIAFGWIGSTIAFGAVVRKP